MKELIIISGKGGTGKTSITAAFAACVENKVLCDADVDAADLHLLTDPDILKITDFKGGGIAVINKKKCSECGTCVNLCKFGAINENFEEDEIDCEGCGVCVDFCPEKAIDFPIKNCGEWFSSKTRFGPMIHAKLGIAEENSGRLVTLVRKEAKKIAEENNIDFILTDGPPGLGCPVIASITGADALLIITEPTASGLHDMRRLITLAEHFKIPCMICINKYDLNKEQTEHIKYFAKNKNISVLGEIPFDDIFIKSMIQGKTILEYDEQSETCVIVKKIIEKTINQIKEIHKL